MKNIFLFLIALFLLSAFCPPSDSFNFMNRELTFGISPETFLEKFPEFKMNNDLKIENQLGADYVQSLSGCEIKYEVIFENSVLKNFILNSNCTTGQDQKIINRITKQFQFIPSDNSEDDEIGDVIETYTKGNLTATAFIGGFYMLTIKQN